MKLSTIADRAALWKLKVSKLTVYKRDKKATDMVTNANGGTRVGNFNKKLFDGNSVVEATLRAYQDCYDYWFKMTVPYLDYEGERMIRSEVLIDSMREFGDLQRKAESSLINLKSRWDEIVQWDLARLKHLGNIADYPADPEPLFSVYSQLRPVPSATDFRFTIPQEDIDSLQRQEEEAAKQAQVYAVNTMVAPISAFIKRSMEYKGEKGERWHDTIVTNIKDVVEQVKSLNIMGDPQIDAFIVEVEQYWTPLAFNPSIIKESVAHRDAAREKLDEIMKRMGAYAGSL